MKNIRWAIGLFLLSATAAFAQPLHVVSSPNVLGFRETARITKITFEPNDFKIEFDKSSTWPEAHVPGWGDPNFTDAQKASCAVPGIDNGCIQFTLWPVIMINGEWFTTGALEFWIGKSNVGGPYSEAGKNWYDKMPPMAFVQPRAGDRVGFMVVAGDQRLKDVRSVEERSSVAWVTVPANDTGVFTFDGPSPQPTPDPTPVPIPPSPDLTALSNRVEGLAFRLVTAEHAVAVLQEQLNFAVQNLERASQESLDRDNALTLALKSVKVPVECRASVFGIPVACKLVQ